MALTKIACNSLKNVAPHVFSRPGSLDRSAIPADKAPLFDAFYKLANSVTPYIPLFADTTLNSKQPFVMLDSVWFSYLDPIRQACFISILNWHFAAGRDYKRTAS